MIYRWDDHGKIEYYSEQVEIVFSAIYNTVNELGVKASELQNRDVTKHLVEIVSFMRDCFATVGFFLQF